MNSKIVAIASSTGGPRALHTVMEGIPKGFEAPILIVQHMPHGFTASLADRLNDICGIQVKEAEEGEIVRGGTAYLAMGGLHMTLKREKASGKHVIRYQDGPTREGVKPCANYMFESLMECGYDQVVCAVLTGMGADGTEGIKNLEPHKKLHIISQNEATCAVYGMPRAIAMTGLVNEVLPLEKIAEAITKEIGTR